MMRELGDLLLQKQKQKEEALQKRAQQFCEQGSQEGSG
jgi:hypothetical protein